MNTQPSRAILAWQSKTNLPILLLILILTLSACIQTAIDTEQSPLFSIEDIKDAQQVKQLSQISLKGNDIGNQEINVELEFDESEPFLSPQFVLPNQNGVLSYYRYRNNVYQIWTYNQATEEQLLIYRGSQEVQSVATALNGQLILASLKNGSHFDIYLFDQRATAVKSVIKLTNSAREDEKNVSMSRDGTKLVWDVGVSFKSVSVCDYLVDTQSCGFSTLSSSESQLEPSISGNGQFVALVRKQSNGHSRILSYNLLNSTYTTIYTRSRPLHHPSVSDDGKHVSFSDDKTSTKGNFYVRVKDLSTNIISTETANSMAIHPHITADGNYLSYNRLRSGGKHRIFTHDINTNNRVSAHGGSWVYGGSYWQKAVAEPYTDPSLVGWWKFDETSGTVATDSSGRGNHATVQDHNWAPGLIDGAFEATKPKALVTIPSSSSIRSMEHLTIMAWANRTLDENLFLIGHNYKSTNSMFLGFHGSAFKWRLDKLYNQPGHFGNCVAGTANTNQWYHITGTYDGSAVKLYVDGVLLCSMPLSGPLSLGTEVFTMAGFVNAGSTTPVGRYFGKIDDVRFYNRALSQQEIVDIYNNP